MPGLRDTGILQWLHQLIVGNAATPSNDGDISASGGVNVGTATGATAGQVKGSGNLTTAAQLESTVATGTAPLLITSTTQVGNLNVAQTGGLGQAASGANAHLLATDSNGKVTVTGETVTPGSNSTSTVQVFQQDGTTIVADIDTTNKRLGIGVAAPAQEMNVMGLQSPVTVAGNLGTLAEGAARISTESAAAVGIAAELQLGGRTTSGLRPIAAISAILTSNSTGTGQVGDVAFSTHAALADAALTEAMRISVLGTLLIGKTAAAGTDGVGSVEINTRLRLSTSQLWAVGTALPATTGTMTATMDGTVKTITPTGACTFNASGGVTGQTCSFVITTSGVSSFVLTWGTAFKTVGTLATGTTTAKVFTISFIYDGTNWNETARTTAM